MNITYIKSVLVQRTGSREEYTVQLTHNSSMYHYTLEILINLVKNFLCMMYAGRSVEDKLQACSVPFLFSKSKLEYVLCMYVLYPF